MSIVPAAIITYLMDKKLLDSKIQNEDETSHHSMLYDFVAVSVAA